MLLWITSLNDLLDEINITTNGALIQQFIPVLEKMDKINHINLSIDSLQKDKFYQITRRDVFPSVYETFEALEKSTLKLKAANYLKIENKNKNSPCLKAKDMWEIAAKRFKA